ncbi:hypothetical protein Hs30E_14160 [Lactococcus hodotermopsidis]|uniref:Sortase n=1 Tax=Pseudolactococcus hodotermopsidis TaxID=2709157 RepID=A0A6A0BDV6_9LACT|nr:sortase [Lactococcus hodotermopsidis]GFH42865.1 hypothetical protein Hs30E_14160 [Lactococcus hodotermopsidis]
MKSKKISTIILITGLFVMLSTIIFMIVGQPKNMQEPVRKAVVSVSRIVSSESSTPSESSTSSQLVEQIPMSEELIDHDENLDHIGKILVEKVGLSLPIVKGRGIEDGTGFDKAIYACTNKTTQVLGENNYVLSAHSNYDSATDYFSPLLLYENGDFDLTQPIDLAYLKLKIGDEIKVEQYADKMTYTFKISELLIDDGEGNFLETYNAMSDIGKPQVTLYTCSDVVGNNRLVIQADFVGKEKS